MTALTALVSRNGHAPSANGHGEMRAIKAEDFWGRWARGEDVSATAEAGVQVDRSSALTLSAVWAAVTLIAEAIASLPLDSFIRRESIRRPARPRPAWITEPNVEQTRFELVSQLMFSLLISGTAYVFTGRDRLGDVVELVTADPERVRPRREGGRVVYDVTAEAGAQLTLSGLEMFHVPARAWPGQIRGVSPLEAARRMIGGGLAAQEFAGRYFGQGLHAAGIVQVPGDLTQEQASELRDDFQRLHGGVRRSHLPAVLSGGASWQPMAVTPEQAQFLESRKFSVAEVARWFRVPPHLIGDVERSTSWGTGIEEQAIGFVTYTLRPWLELLEQVFTRRLMVGPQFVKFNVDGLLRGDFETRTKGYATGRQWGWLSVDEIREKEDMPPLAAGRGQTYLTPLNMQEIRQRGGRDAVED